jgi:hypothetical protein
VRCVMDDIAVGGSLWSYEDYLVEAYSRADVFVDEDQDEEESEACVP